MTSEKQAEIRVFCSYSDEDQSLQKSLERHLRSLERGGGVLPWYKHQIKAGQERQREIDNQLEQADIILLLISSNFISSDDCYAGDLIKALRRHRDHSSRVIAILLKPCTWEELEVSSFQVLPRNRVPITLSKNRDATFKEIVEEIKTVVQELRLSRSWYMEPLQLKSEGEAFIEDSQPIPRHRRASATQRTIAQQRRGGTRTNQQKQVRKAEATNPANRRYVKPLPKAHSVSLGSTIQQFLSFLFSSLSGRAFKQRCRRWKGKSALLLIMFFLLDLCLLPYVVYQLSLSLIITGAAEVFSLFLFSIGVSNDENAIGVLMALPYILLWIGMGLWYSNSYRGPSSLVFLLILAVTILRLFLFLWRTPFGQR